jgi:hypothetical protein
MAVVAWSSAITSAEMLSASIDNAIHNQCVA